jgi:hypothetical protein
MQIDQEVHPQLEKKAKFEVNALGERGSAPPKENFKRVLVVGGSAVESFFLDQNTCWPGKLEKILNQPESLSILKSRQIHVGNLGRSGVDSTTLNLVLQKVLKNYSEIYIIIIMVGASDVLRWLEIDAPIDRPADPMPENELFAQHPNLKFEISIKGSALMELLNRLKVRLPSRKDNAGRWYKKARLMRANAKVLKSEVPAHEIVINTFEDSLKKCLMLCLDKTENVFVFPQPWFNKKDYSEGEKALFWNGGVGKAYKEDITTYYSEQVINSLMEQIFTSSVKIADLVGVPVVDPSALLDLSEITFHDQFHFTPGASKIIATYVADQILTNISAKASFE